MGISEVNIYLPLISGLVGALIGAASSLIAVWIQTNKVDKRERINAAIDLAWREREAGYNHLKSMGEGGVIPPLPLYLLHHFKLLTMLEKGDVDETKLQSLHDEIKKMSEFIDMARSKKSS